jgi:hypothetical protein
MLIQKRKQTNKQTNKQRNNNNDNKLRIRRMGDWRIAKMLLKCSADTRDPERPQTILESQF